MSHNTRRALRWIACVIAVLGSAAVQSSAAVAVNPPVHSTPTQVTQSQITATMLKAPMSFEANQGQTDPSVDFIARGSGYTLFLTPTESVMVLQQREALAPSDHLDPLADLEPALIKQSVVRMKLECANHKPAVEGQDQLPGIVNYFIGNDPAEWRTNIPTYAKVNYQEVYPGIDVAYYGNQGRLEYDFIVAPGADPSQIKLAFEGASEIKVSESGDLLLSTALGDVRLQKPLVYQLEADGHKTLVAGDYILSPIPSTTIRIKLTAYNHEKPLVIDPVIVYSTYLGGSGDDRAFAIAVDTTGHVYVTGQTASANFPLAAPPIGGISDAFVTKLSPAGTSVLYSTYLGGFGFDRGVGIAMDAVGNAYVTGETASPNFPTATPFQAVFGGSTDAFITKLSSSGVTLVYSTYLGGNSGDAGRGITVDGLGFAYVTGVTNSSNFPTANSSQGTFGGGFDAFVTKLGQAGTGLVYSTYLGGNGNDSGRDIAVDGFGQAHVTGNTNSTNFPTASPMQAGLGGDSDAFVTKLSSAGTSLLYSTYLGGNNFDDGQGITVDALGQAHVTGQTSSVNFLTLFPIQATFGGGIFDAFVTKLRSGGTPIYSTYLGGNGADAGLDIAIDGLGQAYVTGETGSTNFPLATPIQATLDGLSSAFVTKLNPTGTSLLYSTYLGGSSHLGGGGNVAGLGIAVGGPGQAYVTGFTFFSNFPTVSPYQSASGGGFDAFIVKLVDQPTAQAGPDQSIPEGTLVTLDGTGSTATNPTYQWTQVSGPLVLLVNHASAHPTFTAPHVPPTGDMLTFELRVCEGTSTTNCSDPDSVNVRVTNVNQPPVSDAGPDQTVQEGSPVMVDGSGSFDPDLETLTYHWTQTGGPAVALSDAHAVMPTFVAPTVGPAGTTLVLHLTVTDPHALTGSKSVSIHISNVNQTPTADAGPDQTVNEQTDVTLNGSLSADPDLDTLHFTWTQAGGSPVALTGSNSASQTFTAPAVGAGGVNLTFQLVVSDGQALSAADTVIVHIQDTNDPPVCALAHPSVERLWPPNHTMVPVGIMGITDPNDQAVTITSRRSHKMNQ